MTVLIWKNGYDLNSDASSANPAQARGAERGAAWPERSRARIEGAWREEKPERAEMPPRGEVGEEGGGEVGRK
eukprot:CAMPEP_0184711238 /NCGR_PEP_ID=MMETSP0314-20130426/1921_1 /TAXON_ID=38298 /ORGANISM="Rhodella maculata, Strain CCMP 736" /LENGTH=72 /DNA_ID=CAMNT_0027173297 /DNA_START=8 /DNA_END=224 /DNA_ORIENTATION=+